LQLKEKYNLTKNKSEKPYEPNPWSLKVTIFVGIVFGFLILTWEIIAHIPKNEYIFLRHKEFIFTSELKSEDKIKSLVQNGILSDVFDLYYFSSDYNFTPFPTL
jgi:hypothetical protein